MSSALRLHFPNCSAEEGGVPWLHGTSSWSPSTKALLAPGKVSGPLVWWPQSTWQDLGDSPFTDGLNWKGWVYASASHSRICPRVCLLQGTEVMTDAWQSRVRGTRRWGNPREGRSPRVHRRGAAAQWKAAVSRQRWWRMG